MPHSNKKFFYHLLAIATAGIWGTTFVATKTLLLAGLTPAEIFIYRFSLAYLCIIFIAGRQVFAKSWLDEIKMIAAGLTGGSVYFTTENTALEFTQASNVGILISITPLLTTLLGMAIYKSERTKRPWRIVAGSSIALIGVAAIVLNGNTEMHFNPIDTRGSPVVGFLQPNRQKSEPTLSGSIHIAQSVRLRVAFHGCLDAILPSGVFPSFRPIRLGRIAQFAFPRSHSVHGMLHGLERRRAENRNGKSHQLYQSQPDCHIHSRISNS